LPVSLDCIHLGSMFDIWNAAASDLTGAPTRRRPHAALSRYV
jgi:hypothetical protein